MPQSRPEKISPESKFRAGSNGSRIETENPRKYPEASPDTSEVMCGSRGHETSERHNGSGGPALLKETDHKFESNAVVDNRIHDDSPELVRRQNNLARDRRTGFKVTDNNVYPTPEND